MECDKLRALPPWVNCAEAMAIRLVVRVSGAANWVISVRWPRGLLALFMTGAVSSFN